MNENKVPCGGFEVDSTLKLTDGKLGVTGGGVYKLFIKSTQVGPSTFVYSFDEDSDIQSYEQLIDKLSSKNNILINKNGRIYLLDEIYSDEVRLYVLNEGVNDMQQSFVVAQQEYLIKNDNTITYRSSTVTLRQSN